MQSPLFIGTHRVELESVDSTNSYASSLLKEKQVFEGTVIMAHHQFGGKGQRGHTWQSEKDKNITISILLFPHHLKADQQFVLTQCASLAIVETLKNEVPESNELKIKWPNDILYSGIKMGGILIENSLRGENLSSSIIGIGLNINQHSFGELSACSLSGITGKHYVLDTILNSLYAKLESIYLGSKSANNSIEKEYLRHLFRLNEWATFLFEGKELEACITGIDRPGKLRLTTREGKQLVCGLQEIAYIL
jgi:BirA family biotin operon repressor/biotin-[acetyl-CoA-carboxylase] ligase